MSDLLCLQQCMFSFFKDWCSGDRYKKDTKNGICYKAWDTQLSWSDAQSVCQREGGGLAVLDADSKIDLLANIPGIRRSMFLPSSIHGVSF